MKLRKKVQGAMVYPVAVICVAALILGFIMTQVIPQFQKMFADMNTALPGPTQALLGFAEAVQNYWWAAPLVIMGMIVLNKAEDAIEVETLDWTSSDKDIEAVVDEAALLD